MKLYQYSAIYIPTKTEKKEDKPEIIVPVTDVLATDDNQANILAARAIPEKYLTKLDRVQVVVRPF